MESVKENAKSAILNYGNREAKEYVRDLVLGYANNLELSCYRQDFNIELTSYFEMNDEENRRGITEIKHITGMYEVWDSILEGAPGMIIDNCASGGRRIDLETTSRSIPLWRTDYRYGEVNGYQCHTYALNFFLPLHGTGVYGGDHYNFRSSMSSAMVTNWEVASRNGSLADMHRTIKQFKELRPYYMEDYYPLTGVKDLTADDVWLAYQLNRPSDNSGIVMAFRRRNSATENTSITVQLKGLNPTATYTVRNDNDGTTSEATGEQLAEGLTLNIANPLGSLMLQYAEKR